MQIASLFWRGTVYTDSEACAVANHMAIAHGSGITENDYRPRLLTPPSVS